MTFLIYVVVPVVCLLIGYVLGYIDKGRIVHPRLQLRDRTIRRLEDELRKRRYNPQGKDTLP